MSNPSTFIIDEAGILTQYTGHGSNIVIPEGVTIISENAFPRHLELTTVTFPSTLQKIEKYAFFHQEHLAAVELPDSVTEIGQSAFWGCKELTRVILSDGITDIPESAFNQCAKLSVLKLPKNLKTIGKNAFHRCEGLREVAFPLGITSIGESAFAACTSLQSIDLPDSLTEIGPYGFHYCYSVKSLTLPGQLKKISKYAFSGCNSIQSIQIPQSVTDIHEGAFSNCIRTTSLTLPEKLKKIGKTAFRNCSGLTQLHFPHPEKVKIGEQAFTGCTGLSGANGLFVVNQQLFAYGHSGDSPWNVTIGNDVRSIEPETFPMNGIYHLQMPIECPVWKTGSKSLSTPLFRSSGSTISFRNKNGAIVAKVILACEGETGPKTLSAFNSICVKEDGGFDFAAYDANWANLSKTDNKAKIALTRLEYPYELSEEMRGYYQDYISRQSLNAGKILIDEDRVEYLAELVQKQLLPKSSLSKLVDYANKSGKTTVTAALLSSQFAVADQPAPQKPAKPKSAGKPQFKAPKTGSGLIGRYTGNDTHVEFPLEMDGATITGIANTTGAVPDHYAKITSIVIPEGYTVIGNKAFAGCGNLETIVLPDSLQQIGHGAFSGCKRLKEVFLSGNITSYGKDVFAGAEIGTLVFEPGKNKLSHLFDGARIERLVICSGHFKSPGHVFALKNDVPGYNGPAPVNFPGTMYRTGDVSIPEIREKGSLARNIHLLSDFDESVILEERVRTYVAGAKAKFAKAKKKPEPLLVETDTVESIDFANSRFLATGFDFSNERIVDYYITTRGGEFDYNNFDYVVLPSDDFVHNTQTKAVEKANKQGSKTPVLGPTELRKHMFRHDEALYGTEVAQLLQDYAVTIQGDRITLNYYIGGQAEVVIPDTIGSLTIAGIEDVCFDENCPFNPMPQPVATITVPKRLEAELRKNSWLKAKVIVK